MKDRRLREENSGEENGGGEISRKEIGREKNDEEKSGKEENGKGTAGWKAELKDWIQILVTAALIAFVLNTFIITNSDIPTPSMENTIMTGSRVVGSRLHYQFSEPERGDIAIFVFGWRCPECQDVIEGERRDICPVCGSEVDKKGKTVHYVKRVIGIPGDIIDIVDGKIYLNDSDVPLEENYLREEMESHPPLHYEVPDDCYFLLGDNRNNSADARFWRNHYMPKEKMKAKVFFEYFPKIKRLY